MVAGRAGRRADEESLVAVPTVVYLPGDPAWCEMTGAAGLPRCSEGPVVLPVPPGSDRCSVGATDAAASLFARADDAPPAPLVERLLADYARFAAEEGPEREGMVALNGRERRVLVALTAGADLAAIEAALITGESNIRRNTPPGE